MSDHPFFPKVSPTFLLGYGVTFVGTLSVVLPGSSIVFVRPPVLLIRLGTFPFNLVNGIFPYFIAISMLYLLETLVMRFVFFSLCFVA